MSRTLTDFSQLSKGMFRKSEPMADIRIPISKTPSDYRSALNTATSIANMCF